LVVWIRSKWTRGEESNHDLFTIQNKIWWLKTWFIPNLPRISNF
jgi:hypothetical protein